MNKMQNIELNSTQSKIYECLQKNGPATRSQLVISTNLPRTTLYDNLEILRNRDLVKKFPRQVNARGRPVIFWKSNDQ